MNLSRPDTLRGRERCEKAPRTPDRRAERIRSESSDDPRLLKARGRAFSTASELEGLVKASQDSEIVYRNTQFNTEIILK